MLRGAVSDVVVKDNVLTGNRIGVLVNGPTSSTVKANTISASTLAAIRVGVVATGNLVLDNIVSSNPVGIDFIPEGAAGAVGNSFFGNAIASNTCGIKGPYHRERLQGEPVQRQHVRHLCLNRHVDRVSDAAAGRPAVARS